MHDISLLSVFIFIAGFTWIWDDKATTDLKLFGVNLKVHSPLFAAWIDQCSNCLRCHFVWGHSFFVFIFQKLLEDNLSLNRVYKLKDVSAAPIRFFQWHEGVVGRISLSIKTKLQKQKLHDEESGAKDEEIERKMEIGQRV